MEDIRFDKRNYRSHSDKNKATIRRSLAECGAGRSIVIDSEGELIAGNGVYEQAQKLGIKTRVIETDGSELVVVKRTDLKTDDEKRKRLALADNAASDAVEWNVDTLQEDFTVGELQDWGVKIGENKETEKGDVEFTEVLDEEHNYIVLYFDNGVDWLQAQTIFNLKPVMNLSTRRDGEINKGNKKIGIGRVIKGSEFINKLLKAEQ